MKKILTAISLFFVAGVAIACTIIDGPSFTKNVGGVKPWSIASDIGGRLQAAFGSIWGRDYQVQGVVYYSVDMPIFGDGAGLHSIPFVKPCGKTFKEHAETLWKDSSDASDIPGGMCGAPGGLTETVIGYTPIYGTSQTCVPGQCTTFTYVQGYEPIYGLAQVDASIGIDC